MSNDLALVLVIAMHVAIGTVVFLMVTRRGWWKPTGDELDWTTTTDCPRCNEHGPFFEASADLLSSQERARDLHQTWHEVTSALLGWMNPTKNQPPHGVSVDNTLRT